MGSETETSVLRVDPCGPVYMYPKPTYCDSVSFLLFGSLNSLPLYLPRVVVYPDHDPLKEDSGGESIIY